MGLGVVTHPAEAIRTNDTAEYARTATAFDIGEKPFRLAIPACAPVVPNGWKPGCGVVWS